MVNYSVKKGIYLPDITSSFSDIHYNFFFELIVKLKPRKIIDFGVLEGFSTISMAKAVKKNGFGHIFSYDLFEKYPYRNCPINKYISNLDKYGVRELVTVKEMNFYDWLKKPENFDLLHIDISNCGDIIIQAYNNLLPFINRGKIVIFEGGGKKRDLVEWMKLRKPITGIKTEYPYEIVCNEFPFISQMVNI